MSSVLMDIASHLFTIGMGTVLGYMAARRQATYNARLAAGAKLRAAFAPEMALMRNSPSDPVQVPLDRIFDQPHKPQTDELLDAAFQERHSAAVEEFRHFVPSRNLAAYEAAWRNYHEGGGHKKSDGSVTYRFIGYKSDHALGVQRIEAILRFTSPMPLTDRLRLPFGRRRLQRP